MIKGINETGTVSDLEGITRLLATAAHRPLWLVDGVQALGKMDLQLPARGVDYAVFSGHKLHAPKGIGLLYVRRGAPFTPLVVGGGQEAGLRSGTENMPGIAALGAVMQALQRGGIFASHATLKTLRDQLTLHRADPTCAACHKMMDPIGFALENFNADGSWRTVEGHPRKNGGESVPLDTTSVLWDGTEVTGVKDLRENLKRYSPQFARFMTEKLLSYAMGRGVEYFDMPVVRSIVNTAEPDNYRFSTLVMNIVKSQPFQMRTKEVPENSVAQSE